MCCCGKPVINGQPGYSWDGKGFSVRQVDPPDLKDGEELLYDGPGRCGGIDSHCHHFRVTRQGPFYYLLVRHGGGDERIRLCGSRDATVKAILALADNDCYWMLQLVYSTAHHESHCAVEEGNQKWRRAAAEKRIKTRKQRGGGGVKVWIESREVPVLS